jgi:hypothetical protein
MYKNLVATALLARYATCFVFTISPLQGKVSP